MLRQLAVFLILFQLVAPLAVAQSQGLGQVLICSEAGSNYTLNFDAEGNPVPAASGSKHCKLCVMSDHSAAGLVPNAATMLPLTATKSEFHFPHAQNTSQRILAYHATAPPLV